MAGITFSGVTKRFDDTTAVADLHLDIDDGEFLVLLGPSGCGKSTALRMLAGLETPTEGTIAIGERVVDDIDPRHRDVAMVFQSYALYPHMTVAKNIESPLIGHRSERVAKATRRALVETVAGMLGLEDLLDRKPGQLSGGQRQRVALARAIVRRPAVFLMDEPLSNLDAKLRAQTRAEIVGLHRELDTTFVYVTHDQVEAMTMASRIAVLDGGRLQQVDDPRGIYERPANVFVARFIGSPPMNVLPGTVRREGAGWAVDVSGGNLPLDGRWSDLADGRAVQVGVRPEHLRPAETGLPVEVSTVEWLGHEQVLQAECGEETISVRDLGEAELASPGSTMSLTTDAGHVHLFDPGSGARLREDGGAD